MVIAVIDDGVNQNEVSCHLASYAIRAGKVESNTVANAVSPYSHGTACAKIIAKGIEDLSIISIKIYEENSSGCSEDLELALKWCIGKEIDYINVSNGHTVFFDNAVINQICYELWKQGTIVVAAMSNWGEYTIPANLPYVIAVARIDFYPHKYIRPDLVICGLYYRQKAKGIGTVGNYNSIACARACNRLAKKKQNNKISIQRRVSIYSFAQLQNTYYFDSNNKNIYGKAFPLYSHSMIKESTISLIVSEAESVSDLLPALSLVNQNIDFLIYSGEKIPKSLKQWCNKRKIRYWDESQLAIHGSKMAVNIPLVIIKASSQPESLSASLCYQFQRDGYNAIRLSDIKKSYLIGYIPFNQYSEIGWLCAIFKPDIAIVVTEKKPDNYDILIEYSQGEIKMIVNEASRVLAVDQDTVYQEILNAFDKE